MPKLEIGLIQIYTGDSKGKTTAALGLAFRALGHGFKVAMVQFMKGSDYYGELHSAERFSPNFEIFQYGRVCPKSYLIRQGIETCDGCGECFVIKGKETDFDIRTTRMAWEKAQSLITSGEYDIVILDEILNAVSDYFALLAVEPVVDFLKNHKPVNVEVIMTGRNAPSALVDVADLVTEMRQIKHPYEKGIPARWGIEY